MKVAYFVLFSILIGQIAGSATAKESRQFGQWELSCPESESTCVLAQTIASTDHNWLATLRIALSGAKDGDDAVVQFLVPPSVHLASGLFSTVAQSEPSQATFVRCNTNACEAVLALDMEALARWKRGRVAELQYRPAVDVPPVVFDVSLMGLTAGLDAAVVEAN